MARHIPAEGGEVLDVGPSPTRGRSNEASANAASAIGNTAAPDSPTSRR